MRDHNENKSQTDQADHEQVMANMSYQAFKTLKLQAKQGDHLAQYELGLAYQNGNGVNKNILKATLWFDKAMKQGNSNAHVKLNDLYQNQHAIKAALENHEHRAVHGDTEAQYDLGCYYLKKEIPEVSKALEWFNQAAQQGHQKALLKLIRINQKTNIHGFFDSTNLSKSIPTIIEAYAKASTEDMASILPPIETTNEEKEIPSTSSNCSLM